MGAGLFDHDIPEILAQRRPGALWLGRQGRFQRQQLAPVPGHQVIDLDWRGRLACTLAGQLRHAGLGIFQPGGQGVGMAHGADRIHQAVNLPGHLGQGRPRRSGGAGCGFSLPVEQQLHLVAQLEHRRLRQQILAHHRQQPQIGRLAAHPGAEADSRAAVLVGRAAVIPATDGDDRATASGAGHQAAQQRLRPRALALAAVGQPRPVHPIAHRLPQIDVEDPQLRPVLDQPFLGRADRAEALAGVGILLPLAAVPHIAARVQLVVQHAAALVRAAVECRHRPGAAAARLHAQDVQLGRDLLAAPAVRVVFENPAHPGGLVLVDLQPMHRAGVDRAVAVGQPAGVAAAEHLPSQPAVRLLGQVAQVLLIQQPAHPARQLAVLVPGVVAVADPHDADALVLKAADRLFLIDDIAPAAIEPLDQQHLELAARRGRQHGLAAVAQRHRRRCRYLAVGKAGDHLPALGRGPGRRQALLVLDRGVALVVRAVPAVGRGAQV